MCEKKKKKVITPGKDSALLPKGVIINDFLSFHYKNIDFKFIKFCSGMIKK